MRLAATIASRTCAVAMAVAVAALGVHAQSETSGATYRVFLKNGQALPSYGQPAEVGDRLVFNLVIRHDRVRPTLQLVSLPVTAVDTERTSSYTDTMRAAYYAATRGEVDYQAMTVGIAGALEELARSTDPTKRLAIAEAARAKLSAWAATSYHYREEDVQELSGLLDLVINELRVSAGQSGLSLSLVARTPAREPEPLLPAPTLEESIALAFSAAEAADNDDERLAILASAQAVVATDPSATELRALVRSRLEDERKAVASYAALRADVTRRAEAAAGRGDARSLEALRAEVLERDRALGQRRPAQVQALLDELKTKLDNVDKRAADIARYNATRGQLLAYERQIRPALSGLDGLSPILGFIRDVREMAFERVINASNRLDRLLENAQRVVPPEALQNVHETIMSALRMAREALSRRRLADVSGRTQAAREASSAASGALLLMDQGRRDLVRGLYPPTSP